MEFPNLPPEKPGDQVRRQLLIDFWTQFDMSGDPGRVSREALDRIRIQVTDCLYHSPPDLNKADGLTAQAQFLINGETI